MGEVARPREERLGKRGSEDAREGPGRRSEKRSSRDRASSAMDRPSPRVISSRDWAMRSCAAGSDSSSSVASMDSRSSAASRTTYSLPSPIGAVKDRMRVMSAERLDLRSSPGGTFGCKFGIYFDTIIGMTYAMSVRLDDETARQLDDLVS